MMGRTRTTRGEHLTAQVEQMMAAGGHTELERVCVITRLTPSLRAALKNSAYHRGVSVETLVRHLILSVTELDRQTEAATVAPDSPPDTQRAA